MNAIETELHRIVRAGLPGAFYYIEDRDGTSQFYTAGYADLAKKRRMTPHDHYRVGSTTKTFTATVTLQLFDEGKLALHDTLQKHLPDLAIPNADSLTIEHLLRMRSGLFDFENDASLLGNLEAHFRPYSAQDVVNLACQHPVAFAPNAKYAYCNTNFCILELIIERITSSTLAIEYAKRIFTPVGLANTSYPAVEDLTLPEPYIRGYERTDVHNDTSWQECSEVFFGRGDGAMISTATDLARFFRALLLEEKLLPRELLHQMMTVITDDPPAADIYGLGLMGYPQSCGMLWGHSGGGYGYGNLPLLRLDTGRFGVLMLNGSYGFQLAQANIQRPRFAPEVRATIYCTAPT